MTSDAVGLASEILTKLGFAQSESLEPGADVRRDDIAALIRRLEKERDEAQTIQLARMALAFERLTILRKMWSAQEVVNWIRGDAAIEMAAAIQRDHAEARNKALDEALERIHKQMEIYGIKKAKAFDEDVEGKPKYSQFDYECIKYDVAEWIEGDIRALKSKEPT